MIRIAPFRRHIFERNTLPAGGETERADTREAGRFPLPRAAGLLRCWPYVVQVAVIALIVSAELGFGSRNLAVPIDYRGDTVYEGTIAKAIMTEGWWWHVRGIGAPGEVTLVAMPILGNIDCALVKLLSLFTHEPGLLLNLYWLTTVLLAAPVATWCLLRLDVDRKVAFVIGALYALSPHIYYRHTSHLMLTHHLIPPVVTVAALLAAGRFQQLRRRYRSALLAGCALIGFGYIYWAFFGCFLLLVGTLIGFLRRREWEIVRMGGLALVLLIGSAAVNLLPSVVSWIRDPAGRNMISYKSALEADIYGLKIRHLLTPTTFSRLPMLAATSGKIIAAEQALDRTNEGTTLSRLGAVASGGFLVLMAVGVLYIGTGGGPMVQLLRVLGGLTVACVLLATVGGFGSIFNIAFRPDIRAYNRISIFIAFLSLAGVSVLLTQLAGLAPRNTWAGLGTTVLLAIVFLAGVADQNEAPMLNALKDADEKKFEVQSQFMRQIEARLPRNAMVYQLPHVPYGDGDRSAPFNPRLWGSAHEEAYLVSHTLRWSWPAVTPEAISFATLLPRMSVSKMVEAIRARGFLGLYIDRRGYEDNGAELVAQLTSYLGRSPVESADKTYAFFNLDGMAKTTQSQGDLYTWGTPITFGPGGNAVEYLRSGWSCIGCTEGNSSTMSFDVAPPPGDVTLTARLSPALFGPVTERAVEVFVNDTRVGGWKLRHLGEYSALIPRELVRRSRQLRIRFEMPNASSPKSFGLNQDTRVLGVAFEQLNFLPGANQVRRPDGN